MYQLACGTDKVAPDHGDAAQPAPDLDEGAELKRLRQRVTELETNLAGKSAAEKGKA
jgi:hypothetical protein